MTDDAVQGTRRVLVAYGSRRGGTAEIAIAIAEALRDHGLEVDCMHAGDVRDLVPYHAVIIGGALYMGRWVREARRFVRRHADALRVRPVWLFSSGPLDRSARERPLPPAPGVVAAMADLGALGHVTFGGRLRPDASGFPAAQIAKQRAGDWRDWQQIRAWASELAPAIAAAPRAVPAPAPRPTRWMLASLCLLVGLSAIVGGLALVVRPDGSLLRMPPAMLDTTPFSSFLIPGLLLLVFVGISNTIAGVLVARGAPTANTAAFVAGSTLFIWILAEMLLLRSTHWLQLAYFAIAFAIVASTLRRRPGTGRPFVEATAS